MARPPPGAHGAQHARCRRVVQGDLDDGQRIRSERDEAACDVHQISKQVTEQLGAGWEPVGNVTIGDAGTAPYLLQAMIKRR